MINTNATNFRRNLYGMLEQAVKYNEPVNVSTKDGNAVVLSEEEYNSIMETLYLASMATARQEIVEGLQTDVEDCLGEDRVQW